MASSFNPTIKSLLNDTPPRPNSSAPTPLRDQLRNARALSAANTTALRAGLQTGQPRADNRSPSVIPEPSPYKQPVGDSRLVPQAVNAPVPRNPAPLSPHAPHKPSKLSSPPQTAEVDIVTQLEPPKLGYASYVVPLSLSGRVREQYYSTIREYRKATNVVTTAQNPDESVVREVRKMLGRLNDISNHVDLDDATASERPGSDQDTSIWAVTNGPKFQFLRHLLQQLHRDNLHIAIVVQQGRLLDIVDGFVRSTRLVDFTRLGSEAPSPPEPRPSVNSERPLRVTLFASANLEEPINIQLADMVIAFDSTFSQGTPLVSALRRHPIASRLSPIVYPMVYSSIEHIERCVPAMSSPLDQLKVMTQVVLQTHHEIGELQPDELKADAAAEEVAAFMKIGGLERDWTIFSIRPIQLVELQLGYTNSMATHVPGTDPYADAVGRKRQLVSLRVGEGTGAVTDLTRMHCTRVLMHSPRDSE